MTNLNKVSMTNLNTGSNNNSLQLTTLPSLQVHYITNICQVHIPDYNTMFIIHYNTKCRPSSYARLQKHRWLKSTQNNTKAQVAQKDRSQKLSSVWVLLLLHQAPPLLLLVQALRLDVSIEEA